MRTTKDEELKKEIMANFYAIEDSYDGAEIMSELMTEMVNGARVDKKELIRQLNYQHRTLQQSLFSFFLKWCHYLAGLDKNKPDVDGRNEASIEVAKKIMEALDNCTGLPFI